MLPTDLRPEDLEVEVIESEVWVSVHTQESTLYTTRVGVDLESKDIQLLLDSLEYLLNKYNEALDYIKSKQNNL